MDCLSLSVYQMLDTNMFVIKRFTILIIGLVNPFVKSIFQSIHRKGATWEQAAMQLGSLDLPLSRKSKSPYILEEFAPLHEQRNPVVGFLPP
jgi:hypothetical protein